MTVFELAPTLGNPTLFINRELAVAKIEAYAEERKRTIEHTNLPESGLEIFHCRDANGSAITEGKYTNQYHSFKIFHRKVKEC